MEEVQEMDRKGTGDKETPRQESNDMRNNNKSVSGRTGWVGFIAGIFIACAVLIGVPPSCGDTGGEPVTYRVFVGGMISDGEGADSFANLREWTITLDEAYTVVGPIYFYSNESVPLAYRGHTGGFIQSANACPAHAQFDKGEVLGEIREQYVVDLLSREHFDMGTRTGVAGTVRLFEVHLHPPGKVTTGGGHAGVEVLNGETVFVRGKAVKDDETVEFIGNFSIPDEEVLRIVEQIPAEAPLIGVDGGEARVFLKIKLDVWFANVDFSSLTVKDESDRFIIDEESQAYLALLSGMRSRYSYVLEGEGGAQ